MIEQFNISEKIDCKVDIAEKVISVSYNGTITPKDINLITKNIVLKLKITPLDVTTFRFSLFRL